MLQYLGGRAGGHENYSASDRQHLAARERSRYAGRRNGNTHGPDRALVATSKFAAHLPDRRNRRDMLRAGDPDSANIRIARKL